MITNRGAIELYVSASGSWTMLITSSNGKACILAAGKYWQTTVTALEGAPVQPASRRGLQTVRVPGS
ncbi:MAG: hypothetical protein COB90_05245 [Hyphomicrobiales bacterium]|nr:MAG: hypothetical protein COB90_05245 [Hyphomicrobiales bacterium]